MKALTVYKASAGSGKTFTIAVEYIKLLINDPLCFKNILAVTFTNKATEEMKLRILSQLYGIWKNLPESETYTKAVCDSLGISSSMASFRAGRALNYLVHNYNYFMVETIDSFFQSVLRNLARELDLTANLKIGLNDVQVEEMAVDKLIESLTSTSIILKWLISYIFSNIDDNKSWNVIGNVKDFGKTIFKDFYKKFGNELNATVSKKGFFESYTKELHTIKNNAKKRMAEYSETFKRETENAGLSVTSYANGTRGISSYFNKLRSDDFSDSKCVNSTLKKCLDDANCWASKASPDRDAIISLVNNKLIKLLNDAETERRQQWELYATADCTLRHLDKLRLLNSIEIKVRELNHDANLFLLSDTQYLLHTMIKDNDSPFIFEKIGCRLEHIMIDEFQDTSSIQWQNFKVLLDECISRSGNQGYVLGNKSTLINNLIVGDVKQSIYRWRSGDWRLLNNIEKQFSGKGNEIDVKNLQTNYRSERNIIDFNNSFFKIATKLEYEEECKTNDKQTSQELLDAYADVEQKARNEEKDTAGLVRLALLAGDDYKNEMLSWIDATIQEILAEKIAEKDVAILVRYNQHIPIIADYIMEKHPELKIVSDEAFRLDASPAVCTIVQALDFMLHPDDNLTKATLAIMYQKTMLQSAVKNTDILTGIGNTPEILDSFLPCGFIDEIEEMIKKPIFEIIDYIYLTFKLDKIDGQGPYICAFYDKVAEFTNNNPGGIEKLLEAWNDDICSKTIQSDETDGIRIISIHKSKGLEYDNVIIPFCDWALENNRTMLWTTPSKAPFNKLPMIPVDYTKKLLDTIYATDYRNEHVQNRVDNLNLLYVAFTRAGRNLFVAGRKTSSSKAGRPNRSAIIQQCLPQLKNELSDALYIEGGDNAPSVFEYGKLSVPSRKEERRKTGNVFLSRPITLNIKIKTCQPNIEFKQSNDSRQFIEGDNESERNQYIKTGNLLHKLLSMVTTIDDVDKAVLRLNHEGLIGDGSISTEDISTFLKKRLMSKNIYDWFSPRWQVFTECSILAYDPANGKTITRRPDRVITDGKKTIVIDYKFGRPRDEHQAQVRQYMHLLGSMGYSCVSGFIWYVSDDNVKEVTL